jgi:hypothetical protein
MEYINEIIDKNERMLWSGKPNFLPFVAGSIFVSLFGLLFMAVPLLGFIASGQIMFLILPHFWIGLIVFLGGPAYSWFVYKYVEYAITDKRVIIKSGLVGRDFKTVDYDQITNVEVNVSIWDKLLAKSSGTICIFSAGTISYGKHGPYATPYRLSNIPNPYEVFKLFKKTSFDVKSDMEYPNKYRPHDNPGYNTKYKPY